VDEKGDLWSIGSVTIRVNTEGKFTVNGPNKQYPTFFPALLEAARILGEQFKSTTLLSHVTMPSGYEVKLFKTSNGYRSENRPVKSRRWLVREAPTQADLILAEPVPMKG
jgi:hypothetical protein